MCGKPYDLASHQAIGFSIDDKHVKRAGLDYWHLVDVQVHENIEELYAKYPDRRYFYATTKAKHVHSDVKFEIGDMLVFGPRIELLSIRR